MRRLKFILRLGLSVGLGSVLCFCTLAAEDLHRLVVSESLIPIRPGVPGKTPFWNEQAKQFIWVPVFDIAPVQGAAAYRFSVTSDAGDVQRFETNKPCAALTPIWAFVPSGYATLRVEALNGARQVIGEIPKREFYRGVVFSGTARAPGVPFAESARAALASVMAEPFVQNWAATGQPADDYKLYRYASKLISAVISAAALYAQQSPPPADAPRVLDIGRKAADYLLSISCSEGTPLEFFPPTYHGAKPTERENDNWTMLISPAEAGQGYLNLFDATGQSKYLKAATRIAATYGRTQLRSGTWPLKVDNRTGRSVAANELIPAVVISFLDRLVFQYRLDEHRKTLDRAVQWTLKNPVRTFDWSAQFDDARLRKRYQNLSKHEVCEFAAHLFTHAGNDRKLIALGEELLRFAEDQFVMWERPSKFNLASKDLQPEDWFVPCSMEQYAMFEPISGSCAFMIMAYVRAYQTTRKPLYLAKAEALAGALIEAQQFHHGRFPTRMVKNDRIYWLNSTVNTARALSLLGAVSTNGIGSAQAPK